MCVCLQHRLTCDCTCSGLPGDQSLCKPEPTPWTPETVPCKGTVLPCRPGMRGDHRRPIPSKKATVRHQNKVMHKAKDATSNKCHATSNKCHATSNKCHATSNKCHATSNKCLTTRSKKLLVAEHAPQVGLSVHFKAPAQLVLEMALP